MILFKLIGGILIIITTTFSGFIFADNFKKRVSQLNEIQRCLLQLENQILFTKTPLTEALLAIALKGKAPIKNIFENTADLLLSNKADSVFYAMKESINLNKDNLKLKSEDLAILLDLSKTLGESDIQGQVSMFNLTVENLKKQIILAEENMNKNIKLYRYLGFTLGTMLVIMVV